MLMLIDLLLTTPPPDPLDKILPWVTTFVLGVLGLVFGKAWGKRESQAVKLDEPVPTVPTRKVAGVVTWDAFAPLVARMDRLERHIDDVRKEQSDQFKELLEAGAAREQRLANKVDDVARAIHSRIDDHLPRPRTPR